MEQKRTQKAFRNVDWNRFQLTFPNGSWISTIWGGSGRYCDQYDQCDRLLKPWNVEDYKKLQETFTESDKVEIMFDAHPLVLKRIYKRFKDDSQPYGYVSIEDWGWIITQLAKGPTWFDRVREWFTTNKLFSK